MSLNFGGINIGGNNGGGGQTIRNQDKTITTNGEYTADEGYTGLGTVTVEVEGGATTEELTVTPTTSTEVYTPTESDAYSKVTVNAVTASIDENIIASNIKSGTTILDVSGNVIELNGETTTVTPTTSEQTITPTSPKNGLTSVTINPVTSSIDNNITAGNIKTGVSILGVTGSVTELNATTLNANTNGIYTPTSPNNGYSSVTVSVPSSDYTPFPANTAGLYLWLDGDYNTRNGVDRSKKYMENLVWNQPYSTSLGNVENTSNYNNNVWVDTKFLHFVDGYALYPQVLCTTDNEFTIELVAKITTSFSGNSQTLAGLGTSSIGGVTIGVSPDNIIYFYYPKQSSGGVTLYAGGVSVGAIHYHYCRVTSSGVECGIPGLNKTKTDANHPKADTQAFNCGVGSYATTGSTSTATGGNYAVGMLRVWSRALTDTEITRNYQDAKNRFNCV